MTTNTIRSCAVTLFILTAGATSLHAQRMPDVRGLHLGAAINATSIKLDETAFSDDERENGYGADLYAGYNFTRNLGVTLGITGANINDSGTNDFSVAHIDLGGRLSFPGSSPFVPYLELSLAGVGASYKAAGEEVELKGTGIGLGFTIGAGFTTGGFGGSGGGLGFGGSGRVGCMGCGATAGFCGTRCATIGPGAEGARADSRSIETTRRRTPWKSSDAAIE